MVKTVFKYLFISVTLFCVFSCKHQKSISKSSNSDTVKAKSNSSSTLKSEYAFKLGVKESDIINEELYSFINEWYAVPYKYAGKDKAGIDCSGLTAKLYLAVYKKTISSNTKSLVNEVKQINESELKEGDLVFFITNGKTISHVGVYLQNHKFVHASTKRGVMISDMNEPYFKQNYARSGRVK
jgi:murein DD-endopeptidase / murein LD-carboxypeptidase